MSSSPLKLKNARNWFAAGIEVQQAIELLTDGAFKVFMHICLNAERATGILPTTQSELARTLDKSHGTIRKYLGEMEKCGVSINHYSYNPVARGSVRIFPAFWPYENGAVTSRNDDAVDVFMMEIRNMLSARACVRVSFSTADEVTARQWLNAGIPLDRIGQAILLGCARKYVAWRNNQALHGPILTLRYFDPILEEIGKQKLDSDYWEFLRCKIQRQEKIWIQKHQEEIEPDSKIKRESVTKSAQTESE